MAPGRACIGCHADANAASGDGDAPLFAFAGTVFSSEHEPDDCVAAGGAGAVVELTGAHGAVIRAVANASGNFYYDRADDDPPLALPYTARVHDAGGTRVMVTPQTSGDCNACHTAAGQNGARGRIRGNAVEAGAR